MEGATAYSSPHEALANPPQSSLDKELTAIKTIHTHLSGLDATARVRVWRYVNEVMGNED